MADTWYVGIKGQRSGPFTSSQVRQMAARGELGPSDVVWREGMANWVAASTIRGLFGEPATTESPPGNPYAAPAASDVLVTSAGLQAGGGPIVYAEFLPRVGAALLDALFLGLMNCIPAAGMGVAAVVLAGRDQDAQQGFMAIANLCSNLLGFAIGVTYYVVLETSSKQGTWGKQIVGIKVTDLQGNRITAGRAIGRYFAKILSGCTLGIGFLMPLFTEKKQTLHDMIAGCLALKK